MPIYEFLCKACHRPASLFVKSIGSPLSPACPLCGSTEMERRISSFAYHKSIKTVHEESGEPGMVASDDYYKDPRNIGRWAEKRLQDMGVEMPESAREMIQAAREGELPPPVKDL